MKWYDSGVNEDLISLFPTTDRTLPLASHSNILINKISAVQIVKNHNLCHEITLGWNWLKYQGILRHYWERIMIMIRRSILSSVHL